MTGVQIQQPKKLTINEKKVQSCKSWSSRSIWICYVLTEIDLDPSGSFPYQNSETNYYFFKHIFQTYHEKVKVKVLNIDIDILIPMYCIMSIYISMFIGNFVLEILTIHIYRLIEVPVSEHFRTVLVCKNRIHRCTKKRGQQSESGSVTSVLTVNDVNHGTIMDPDPGSRKLCIRVDPDPDCFKVGQA
jgi:hypothetical protein